MNGIILVDKGEGMTSFSACASAGRILGEKKRGHAGTLDPNATGLLVVCLGSATRLIEYFPEDNKEYIASVRFGITTDTQDIWGNITGRAEADFSLEDFKHALEELTGTYNQLTPAYSARKKAGRPLYEYARKGIALELPEKEITISSIEILSHDLPQRALIKVNCSKGAYIRALCDDIGRRLKCGGTMESLRRLSCCGFSLGEAHTLEEIDEINKRKDAEKLILPPDRALTHIPAVHAPAEQLSGILNGMSLKEGSYSCPKALGEGEIVRIYSEEIFAAMGSYSMGAIKPKKVIYKPNENNNRPE